MRLVEFSVPFPYRSETKFEYKRLAYQSALLFVALFKKLQSRNFDTVVPAAQFSLAFTYAACVREIVLKLRVFTLSKKSRYFLGIRQSACH